MRTLLILALVVVGVWWLRRMFQQMLTQRSRERAEDSGRPELSERIRSCEHCGLHVPESEGVTDDGHFFCSDGHRRLGVKH